MIEKPFVVQADQRLKIGREERRGIRQADHRLCQIKHLFVDGDDQIDPLLLDDPPDGFNPRFRGAGRRGNMKVLLDRRRMAAQTARPGVGNQNVMAGRMEGTRQHQGVRSATTGE